MPTLAEFLAEVRATRTALDGLSREVKHLAARDETRRKQNMVLFGLTVATAIVVLLMITGSVVFVVENRNNDERFSDIISELSQTSRNAFMTSCNAFNDQREAMRADNVADAELLISITGADVRSPEQAQQLRDGVAAQNASLPNRDCEAELAQARKDAAG